MTEVAASDVQLSTVRMTDGASLGALSHPDIQRSDNGSDAVASRGQRASPSGAAAKPSESRANQRNQLRSSKEMIETTGGAGGTGRRGLLFLHPANKSVGQRSFPQLSLALVWSMRSLRRNVLHFSGLESGAEGKQREQQRENTSARPFAQLALSWVMRLHFSIISIIK